MKAGGGVDGHTDVDLSIPAPELRDRDGILGRNALACVVRGDLAPLIAI